MIPAKYQEMGYEISQFGAASLALKRNNQAIFVFRKETRINENLIQVLCNSHLKMSERKHN